MNTQPNTADVNGNLRTVLSFYTELGWKLVPVHKDSRHPHYRGWNETAFSIEHILEDMAHGHGVGVQTGPVSNWLCAVDLDSHNARVCAPDFLPDTLKSGKEGEAGGLSSHWLYYSVGAHKITVKPLDTNADKGTVVELLGAPNGQGRQFIVPPSMHPKKGRYVWDGEFSPDRIATIDASDLEKRVRRLGAAALIAGHLPSSGLHHYSLALAGFMLRNREDAETVEDILISAWRAHGLIQIDGSGLRQNVRDTVKNLAAGKKVTGGKEVNKTVPGLAQKIADALGWEEGDRPLTPEERKALANRAWPLCEAIATRPNITADFAATLHANGVAGESKQIRLLYLALVSRLLDKQVNVAIKGPSSGGKSYLMESVLNAFPESAYYGLSTMSEKALIYLDEDMRHRYLVIAEASGMQGDTQSYLIRTLLSEGRIRYQTAEATASGVKPRLLEMEGPTGLLVSTTATSLHPENETRLFSLLVTDTPEQTKGVFKALAQQKRKPVSLDTWRSLQTWLEGQQNEVIVPYASALAELVPPLAVRLRRDFRAVLQLIKAHAVLHQARRERDEDGWIVATLDDYRMVRSLVGQMVAEGVGAGVSDTVRETVEAVRLLTADEAADDVDGEKVTSAKRVAAELQIDKSAASRRIKAALEGGYLKDLREHKNRPQKLAMGDPMPEQQDVLPDPAQLREEAENLGCWVARQSEGIPPETAEAGSGLQNPECNPSQPNNPDGENDDELSTEHYDNGVKTRQEERIGPPMTLDSAETGEGSNGRATEQPSTKKGRKRRFRRATQPSVQPSTNGHKTAPAEVLELAVGQAQPAGGAPIGKDGIPGEYGQVVSLQERAEMSINDFRGVFGEPPSRLVVNTDRRPRGWRLQEDVKQWLSYLAVLASSELPVPAVLYALSEWLSPPPPRVQRWIELELNSPERFHDMPDEKRRRLLAWVQENVAPRRGKRVRDSYWLKHRAEEGLGYYDEKLGMRIRDYVSNGELKGGMLEAGHRPVWDNRINMGFCCAAKPGSPWGNELREEAEARREMWKPQPGPEEILRELFQQIATGEGEAA
jgi:hypothetical protein